MAIGTPSSGLKPIVVSTERPSRTAVTEQPPPRWQTTRRGTATRSAAHWTESPWKPYRRIPHSSRQRAGTAYVRASAGSVAWNVVSKTATCGTSGKTARAARIPSSAGALCSGASSVSATSSRSTASSITTGPSNREPPCTTRCATASTSRGTSSSEATGSAESSEPTRESLRLVEPALTTRIVSTARSNRGSRGRPRRGRASRPARAGGGRPSPAEAGRRSPRGRAPGRSRPSRGGTGRGRSA